VETINKKITAFDVFMMIDKDAHLRWTFDEREKYLCVLRNAKEIVDKLLLELTDTEWQERSNYKENLHSLNRYISIAQQIRVTDFDGRIEPKKDFIEFHTTPLYGFDSNEMAGSFTDENHLKAWEAIVVFAIVGALCYLVV
jgi:hypothetical protein